MDRDFERRPHAPSPRKTARDVLFVLALVSPLSVQAQESVQTEPSVSVQEVAQIIEQPPPLHPFYVNLSDPTLNLNVRGGLYLNANGEAGTHRAQGETSVDDEIVVTGQRVGNFVNPTDQEFRRNSFADAGMTTIRNPDNEGLGDYAPVRRDDEEGWRGVDVEALRVDNFTLSARIQRGPGIRLAYHFPTD